MARPKTYKLGAINISIEKHHANSYKDLFEEIFSKKLEIKLRGSSYAEPKSYKQDDGVLIGSIFKYVNIDPNKPWLDKNQGKEIVDEEGNPIPQTEPNLSPNCTEVHFIFNLKHHRLIFISDEISPNTINDFFNKTFERLGISMQVSSTIEQSMEQLEDILNIPYLRRLDIFVNIPNPDDYDGLDHQLEARLKRINASSVEETYRSKNDNLKPDEETKAMMKLATSNGSVYATGTDENFEKINLSTEDKPMLFNITYNHESETFWDKFKSGSALFLEEILGKIR